MSRLRFTDCDKWSDPWFLELPPEGKLLWQYVCDRCDNAGVIHLAPKLLAVELGTPVDVSQALQWFGDRIEVIKGGKWYLTKFILFQHPHGLNTESPIHRQVIRCLEAHGLHDRLPGLLKSSPSGGLLNRLSHSLSDRTKDKTRPAKDHSSEGGSKGETDLSPAAALLESLLVSTQPRALREWRTLAKAEACCESAKEILHFLEWAITTARNLGRTVEYAKHCLPEAAEWCKSIRERFGYSHRATA